MKQGWMICLFLLGACASTPDEDTALGTATQLPPPQGEDVLFAKLVKQADQWQLLALDTRRMPVDLLKGEERVYIRTDTRHVMPDYVYRQYRNADKTLFECGTRVTYNKHTTYNPCVSLFSNNIRFGEGWFGWTRRLDREEIQKAVSQTDLLQRANQKMVQVKQERERCQAMQQQAQQVVAHQKLAVRVIDKTGLYPNGHEAVSYDLHIRPEVAREGCEHDLAQVKLDYDLNLEQNLGLVLELRGKTDWRQPNENTLTLQRAVAEADSSLLPTLYITGKKVNHYNLYQTWSNRDVEIVWRTLDITATDLHQLFDLRNRSRSPVEIRHITFYINQHAIEHRQHYRLAPQAGIKALEHASRYFLLQDKIRRHIEAIKTIDSRTEQAEFGIRLDYTVDGKRKTFTKTDSIMLTSVL